MPWDSPCGVSQQFYAARPLPATGTLQYSGRNLFGTQTICRTLQLSLSVNGEAVELSCAGYKTLLEVLREDLGLTGTKHGCELGECGACAVLIDGAPQLSCLVLAAECEGRAVETVEGLSRGAELHP